jgi:ribosomal protein L29
MKKADLTKMSEEDLHTRLNESVEELESARLKFQMGQFKRTSEFPRLRKEIARIKTLLRGRAVKAGV